MKKRIQSILLAAAMIVSMFSVAFATENTGVRVELSYREKEIQLDAYLTAEDLTNGRIVLNYDAAKVVLAEAQVGDDSWISSVNTTTAGQVGFAWVGSNLTDEETLMVTLVFTEKNSGSGDNAVYTATVLEAFSHGAAVTLDVETVEVVGEGVGRPVIIPPVSGGGTGAGTGGSTSTEEEPDGTTTTTVVNKDGSVTETVTTSDGTTATTVTDAKGEVVSVAAEVPKSAITEGESVTLPVEVKAADSAAEAVPVEITVPKAAPTVTVEIPVENVAPSTVVVLVHADGTEEVVPKTVMTENGVAIDVDESVVIKVVDNAKDFVDDNTWAADAIAFVTSRELFNGTSENTFSPNDTMSRAMLATVLWRMEGKEEADNSVFSDVAEGKWYTEAIEWASEEGIINGYGTVFGINDAVTREQMITILYRLVGEPAATTTVSGTSSWSAKAMAWAVEVGLIQGNGSGLNAYGTASRAEVATILMRFMSL